MKNKHINGTTTVTKHKIRTLTEEEWKEYWKFPKPKST
jgi:hypothetical protein